MYSILLLLANVLAFYVEGIYGFTIAPIPPSLGRINTVTTQTRITTCHGVIDENNGVQEASLAGLGDDHEVFGESMAKSIALWLDDEVSPITICELMSYWEGRHCYIFCLSPQ